MEQFRQVGKVLGSMKALMVFQDYIQINQRQCCLLVDIFSLAFKGIGEQIKQELKFEERSTKWEMLEQPLKELHRIFKEGECYIQQCLDTKDWWAKAILLANNTDCIEFHIHNLLCCIPVIVEAIELAVEISGSDQDEMQKKRLIFSRKYNSEWMDPKVFEWKFGTQYLVPQDICSRIRKAWKEDRWILLQTITERSSTTKQEQRLKELLCGILKDWEPSNGSSYLLPSSILVGSKDYQVRRRLDNGSQFKEIQWLGESWAVRHFFADMESLVPKILLLSSFTHPNVLHVLCGFSDEEKKECFLLMELMSKDLCNYIKELCGPRRRLPFSLLVAVDLMLQIARGMEYLHFRKIYHGDLNPSNILVRARNSSDGYLHAKVSGFNLPILKNASVRSSSNNGTQPFIWYAPEVLLEQEQPCHAVSSKYTEKADVYSFGMICFQLLTGKVPFEDGHLQGDKMSRNIRAGERPLFPFSSPKYLVNLTKKCWQTDPTQRPSFSSICRVLRSIKRFLVMNPNHSQPEAPCPSSDYCEVDAGLSKKYAAWGIQDLTPVPQIPFQMFVHRVVEKEKVNMNPKDKNSESGSDGASACGEENAGIVEDHLLPIMEKKPLVSCESNNKKTSTIKRVCSGKPAKQPGTPKGRMLGNQQLNTSRQSFRMNSESRLLLIRPNRRRASGHASDSELA